MNLTVADKRNFARIISRFFIKPNKLKFQFSIFFILIILFILFLVLNPKVFLSKHIYSSFMSTIPFLGIMALSMTPIVILGELDLSFPSILAMSSWILGATLRATHNIWLAAFLASLFGIFAGYVNYLMIIKFGIPSIVATLGTMFFWRGLVNVLAEGQGIPLLNASGTFFYKLCVGRIAGIIPAQSVWFLLLAVFFFMLLKRFNFSSHILCISENKKKPLSRNRKIKIIKIVVFLQMGFFSAFSGILSTMEVGYFWPSQGQGYLFPTIAAVFIGGTSMFGGSGTILGTFFGAIIIGSLDAGIVAVGFTSFWTQLIYGVVIIVCILLYNKDFNFKSILANIMDITTDNIFFKDKSSRFVLINNAMAEYLGLHDPSDAIGRTDSDFYQRDTADRSLAEEKTVLATGEPLSIEVEENMVNVGDRCSVLIKKYPFFNEKGEIIGTFGIGRDITEKNRSIEREKQMQKQILEERDKAGRQKTQFFINLAHEVKTPLTLIKNYLDKYIKTAEPSDDLQIIKQNIDKLLHDMVNYLDAEKLTTHKIFYNHKQIVNLTKVVENEIVLFSNIAVEKNITISSDLEKGVMTKADPYAIDRIVNNLMDNSVKYTDPGGRIHIALNASGGKIILRVKDNGIGIGREQKQHIFEAFYQLSHEKRNIQGIGMGLFIVKNVITSLGGEITVESEVNKGTEFTVKLSRYEISRNEIPLEPIKSLYSPGRCPVVRDLEQNEFDKNKSTILVIDDNIDMLAFLQTSLKAKYNVVSATNGEEALNKICQIPVPDLIISDIMMDGIDGYQLYMKIHAEENFSHIPFIFLTAKNTNTDKIKALSMGAMDYICKPFLIDEIRIKVENIIRNNKNLRNKDINEIRTKLEQFLEQTAHSGNGTKETLEAVYRRFGISNREKQVMILLSEGLFNKEISHELEISRSTVDYHIHNIYRKLGVQNKVELVNLIKSY